MDEAENAKSATPVKRQNAKPVGLARSRPRTQATSKGRPQDRLVMACDVEPCRCPLCPLEGSLHDLLKRINGEGWPDEVGAVKAGWDDPRKAARHSPPLAPEDRLVTWLYGLHDCWHAQARGRMDVPCDERWWWRLIALWAEVLLRSDRAGYRERPPAEAEVLPPDAAGRVAVYARRAERGVSLFCSGDTVAVPVEDMPAVSPEVLAVSEREATLAEALRMGRERRKRIEGRRADG